MMSELPSMSLEDALTEVEARFIVTLPKQEIKQTERLFFHIEQGYWFYEDFFADEHKNLPHFKNLKAFTEVIVPHCPQLRHLTSKLQDLFESFCSYREAIPVCGCIMLNSELTKMVLVRNWKGTSWSFPRGKINQHENPFDCAIRETMEETGFNAREYCSEENVITFRESPIKAAKMYIAIGVPEDAEFCPQTRKEISKVEFHDINNLPKNNWGVFPFMKKLHRWIEQQNSKVSKSGKKSKKLKSKRGDAAEEAIAFNNRNASTFGDIPIGQDSWGVEDMFSTNSRLTGREYVYDGNPHNFGSVHPRYVNYNQPATTALQAEPPNESSVQSVPLIVKKLSDEEAALAVPPGGGPDNSSATAAEKDIIKIRNILRYLSLPVVPIASEGDIQYAKLISSIQMQRKMVKKVKEAGGLAVTEDRMKKILNAALCTSSETASSNAKQLPGESCVGLKTGCTVSDSGSFMLDTAAIMSAFNACLESGMGSDHYMS